MHLSTLKKTVVFMMCCYLPCAPEIGGTAGLEFPRIPTQNPGQNTKSLLGNKFLGFNQRKVPHFRKTSDPSLLKIPVLNPLLSFVMLLND
jgi:hypothetical protein